MLIGRAARRGTRAMVTVRCDCGVTKEIGSCEWGKTKSCGCKLAELGRAAATVHGGVNRPEYNIWKLIKRRCGSRNDSRYESYGGRGIAMCARWRASFAAFLADMGARPSPRHSVEREDNEKGYEPDNCIWATALQQAANRRTNRMLTHAGVTMHLSAWARRLGIKRGTLEGRLRRGLSTAEAFTRPVAS